MLRSAQRGARNRLLKRVVNLIQLYHDGRRWWVISVLWDNERPGLEVPLDWRRNEPV